VRICVLTPRYAIAGVPLAQIRFARALTKRGHDVDLVIGYVDPQYEFPGAPDINVHVWNQRKVRGMLFPLVRYLRSTKPDVVFSAEDHLNAIVLFAAIVSGAKAKISGSSRVLPTDRNAYSNKFLSKGWLLKQFMKSVMWRADALTCVSKDMVEHYRRIFDSPPHVCVYNIIDDKQSRVRMQEPVEHEWFLRKECPVVIAAGTMTTRKGFADLVQGIKVISYRRRVRLVILGEGRLRAELEALVLNLGLSELVWMPGNVANALKYFAHADVFVLSSYAEGLPNVLVEAMMCGCTPVSTDCPTGPREVLQDGKYGYLVPMRDPEAMAAAIERALDNPIPRSLLEEAVRPFEEETVLNRHFEVLGLHYQTSMPATKSRSKS
jgi:glycosyltransferase involved in cell wall biosynthesis